MSEMPSIGETSDKRNNDQLSFVGSLVQQFHHTTTTKSRQRDRLPDLVKTNLKPYKLWIEEVYKHYQDLSFSDQTISLTAEWILDNYYILQQAFQLIEEYLPAGYQEQLPRLLNIPYKNFPRIFALVRVLLGQQNYLLEMDVFKDTLDKFQEQVPLTMGELWAIPIYLRFGLLERLAHILHTELKPQEPITFPDMPPVLSRVSTSEVDETQSIEIDQTEKVAGIVRSLRQISEIHWEEIFESLSLVEINLRKDPAGIYTKMDFKTRNLYRGEIEKLAKWTGEDEIHLSEKLLQLCQKNQTVDDSVDSAHQRREHVGVYLLGKQRKLFEDFIEFRPDTKSRITNSIKNRGQLFYLGSIGFIAVALIAGILFLVHNTAFFESVSPLQVLLMFVVTLSLIPPVMIIANHLVNIGLNTLTSPSVLPKMDFRESIPEEFNTLVVIPGLISGLQDIENLVRQIEIHYLSNPQQGLKFALLTDFSDAESQTRPEDDNLVYKALEAIANLNEKYTHEHGHGVVRFFLFHRHRLWNPTQGIWMGWERKRGKLHELGLFLGGDDNTSFNSLTANAQIRNQIGSIKYVITVDADTVLPPGTAVGMVGTLAHPLNQARFDQTTGRIVSGYTILQPRVDINPRSANQTWFTRIFAGDTGLDLYSHAVSDVYQDLFGEGIYVGKGIYDVKAMMHSVENHIPENALLSHDLLEGILGRAGLISDITLIEDYPANYYEQVARQRRWIRGDWQLLPWLLKPAKFSVSLSSLDSWKIIHNLLRSLLSPTLMIVFLVGIAFLPDLAWLWVLILLTSFGIPLVNALVNSITRTLQKMRRKAIWPSLWPVVMRWLFAIAFLPYEAYYTLDAILVTLYRLYITHRKLLSWTTAERASQLLRSRSTQNEAWKKLSLSAILVVTLLIIAQLGSLMMDRTTILLQMPVLPIILLWISSSGIVWLVNKPLPSPKSAAPIEDVAWLRLIARRTWNFFENFVGPQDHWLPPDHFQEAPNPIIAHHTSPSNIGLFLTSAIAAYDLGYFDQLGLAARLETTIHTLTQMERYRGHFLNWYSTQTLEPLKPRYVSTVDSGNLVVSLVVVSQTCKTIVEKRVFRREIWEGYMDNLINLQDVLADFKRTFPKMQIDLLQLSITIILNRIRAVKNHPLQWYPTFTHIGSNFWPNLSRNLGDFIASIPANVEFDMITRLQEAIQGIEKNYNAMQHTINELVPWIPYIENIPSLLRMEVYRSRLVSLKELLTYNPRLQEIPGLIPAALDQIDRFQEEIEGSPAFKELSNPSTQTTYVWMEGLRKSLRYASENASRLKDQFGVLEKLSDEFMEAMDFSFLYNPARHVFHIGFNLETGQLDNNYYDLLASEARIASLFAISRGQVPYKHWMHLNRPITRVDGSYALLSWSGTMFEYLMPTLFFQSHVNTLIHKSVETMVRYQQTYAHARNTPWGISESGFFQFDTNKNYQYRAFGVPALGFKRGLADDLVVAPYASLIAINWAPSAVEKNARSLISHGAYGPYGFYESIDFTRSRISAGKRYEVVREYMSHHQGMILLALVNYLRNDVIINRIHEDPQLQSVDLLLQEQVPTGVPLLLPGEQETRGTRRVSDAPVEIAPWSEPVASPAPRMHLLSNGSFSTFISNSGSGYSRWKEIDLTRWRPDGVLDPWGTWIYIQDMKVKQADSHFATWSVTHRPIPGNPEDLQVNYFPHMAVYKRTQNELTTNMEVTVSSEDPLEIRRIHLINHAASPRRLRLTSYGEVVLNHQAADARHPAYNKLFIESEFDPELNLLIFKQRKDSTEKQPVFLGHMLTLQHSSIKKDEDLPVKFETDRMAFIGRGNGRRDPTALQSNTYLTGSTGFTLDPIFALGKEIVLKPHETFSLAYITIAAPTKSVLLKIAQQYGTWRKIEDTFVESNVSTLIWMAKQNIERDDLRSILNLLTLLFYPNGSQRANPETLARNELNQAGLWRFGISGDYPIVLLEIEDQRELNLLVEVVRAQAYLRTRGYKLDLVILNTKPSMYTSDLNDMVLRRIRSVEADQWLNQRSGIFVRSADQMQVKEQVLLRSVARVLLHGNQGPLVNQLQSIISQGAVLPSLHGTRSSRRSLPAREPWESKPSGELQFFNGYGGFSAEGHEYIIHLPHGKTTPAPWVNIIGYPHFGFMVSQSGSQTTWSINSAEYRISPWSNDVVSDPSGEVLYLRDEETGDIWTPTPLPAPAPHGYRVRHGAGYTVFETESHGLQQEMTLFASPEDAVKIVHLKVKNSLKENRRLTATYYLEWVLGTTHGDTYPTLIPGYNPEYSMLQVRNPYHADLGGQIVFLMANRTPHGFTTDRLEFLGSGGSMGDPAALHRIGLSNTVATGRDTCAALQLHIDLLPDGSDELYFVVGAAHDEKHLTSLAKKYQHPSRVSITLEKTHAFWENLLTQIQVNTPDLAANLMLNSWWLYQTLSCRVWARSGFYQSSGAFGFRDQLQDVLALLNIDPSITRSQILNAAQHQFQEGDVLHWWHPPSVRGVRTRISDNLIWLPYVASQYAAATGDASIWDEKIPFVTASPLKSDEVERYGLYDRTHQAYTLFDHCQRALQKGATIGAHGLPLIGSGDWNDGLNLVGSQGKGESTWLAWLLIDTLKRFAEICEQRGDPTTAENYRDQANAYFKAIDEQTWEGEWYLRAFYDDGTPLGSRGSKECQIDAIAQSWSVLSGAGDRQKSLQAMNSVWERLVDINNNLSLLFTPPFDKTSRNPGYIKDYPPGVRENGGQYTHAAAWTAWALAGLGDGERAWHLFDMLNPIYQADTEKRADHYRVEPYVSAADIYSQGSQLRRGGWTWYTGSAGWLYRLGVEQLLGLLRKEEVLHLDPIIPARWDGFTIRYRYLNTSYLIHVSNPKHVITGVERVLLDGKLSEGKEIPLSDDEKDHLVEVIMGES